MMIEHFHTRSIGPDEDALRAAFQYCGALLQARGCSTMGLAAHTKNNLDVAIRSVFGEVAVRVLDEDNKLDLDGITVDALDDNQGIYAGLATSVAAALPGLRGYVGIDFIATDDGPVVLEINPRLTTSYCGLGAILGTNPAELIISAASGKSDRTLKSVATCSRKGQPVLIDLHGAQFN